MNRFILVIIISLLSLNLFSQTEYPMKIINEFANSNEEGCLYIRDQNSLGPFDDMTGNDLVFDETGTPLVFQHDSGKLFVLDSKTYKTTKICTTPLTNSSYEKLIRAENNMLVYFSSLSNVRITQLDGTEVVFFPYPGFTISSVYYYALADILFFIDESYKLHCVLNPGTDQGKNMKNYRNPEQTVDLFKTDSVVDLKGLSRDDKGRIFRDDVYIGPTFMPVIGQYQYYLNRFSVTIGTYNKRISDVLITVNSNEIHESTAIHPSGDIFILRYNQERNKHILYKIVNTWDLDAKNAWDSQKK